MNRSIKKITALAIIMGLFTLCSFAGIEWMTSIKTTGEGKNAKKDIDSHSYAQGGNVKQVFEGVSKEDMFYFQDGYWLYKAKDDNIYIVNDKEQKYMTISIDGMLQMTGMVGQLVKIEILDHTIDTEALPEETILGFPCTHLRITTHYTMKMKILFIKKTLTIHEVKELWGTTKIPGFNEINPEFIKKDMKTGIPDLDELIKEQVEKQEAIGFLLKVVSKTTQMDKKGKPGPENTYTMTVTKIDAKDFPASFFDIPESYKKEDGPWEKDKLF